MDLRHQKRDDKKKMEIVVNKMKRHTATSKIMLNKQTLFIFMIFRCLSKSAKTFHEIKQISVHHHRMTEASKNIMHSSWTHNQKYTIHAYSQYPVIV